MKAFGKTVIFAAALFSLMAVPLIVHAFDDKRTHPDFTGEAVKKSSLNKFMTIVLGFDDGYNSTLPYYNDKVVMDGVSADQIAEWNRSGWPILELLKAVSASEDTPDCRASNHFYNTEVAI